jgi:hypothetical protein
MKRQNRNLALVCRAAAVVIGALILLATGCKKGEVYRVTVGTYGEHIYTCEFNPQKNEFV